MKLEVHVLTNDADWILPWTLRHYGAFASKIVVHDGGPDWREGSPTRDLCACHGAEWRMWDTAGQLNDELARHIKNEAWKGTDADWVAVVDADELLFFPDPGLVDGRRLTAHKQGVWNALYTYDRIGAAVIRPEGFEMFSDAMPDPGSNQIWIAIRDGAPDDKWYGKPVLFSPKIVSEAGLGIGAHESRPVLKDGRALRVDQTWPHPNPRCLLLHYHQIGPIDAVAARYDATRKRLARINEANGWGNFDAGLKHAQDKRSLIVPNLCRVVE